MWTRNRSSAVCNKYPFENNECYKLLWIMNLLWLNIWWLCATFHNGHKQKKMCCFWKGCVNFSLHLTIKSWWDQFHIHYKYVFISNHIHIVDYFLRSKLSKTSVRIASELRIQKFTHTHHLNISTALLIYLTSWKHTRTTKMHSATSKEWPWSISYREKEREIHMLHRLLIPLPWGLINEK